jgi:hypothetical protein
MLATQLLQRARCADPRAGLWEAADVQWWWRTPRRSDDVEKLFWIDDEGPVAAPKSSLSPRTEFDRVVLAALRRFARRREACAQNGAMPGG